MNTWTDPPLLLRLMLTEQCNLRCRYCYADKRDVTMSPGVLKDAADLIRRETARGRRVSVELTGGEPLLAWDLLDEFVTRLRDMVFGGDIPVMTITNGVLLNDRRNARLAQLDVALRLSMDGGRVEHMAHRRAAEQGLDYFDTLSDNAAAAVARGVNVTVNMVVSPATVDHLVEGYFHLYDLTGRYVKISPAIGIPWSSTALDRLDERLGRLGRLLLRHRRRFAAPFFTGDIADDISHAAYVVGEAAANPGALTLTVDPEGVIYRDEFEPRTRSLLAVTTLGPDTDPAHLDTAGDSSMQLVYNRRLYPDDVLAGQKKAYGMLRQHLGFWYADLIAATDNRKKPEALREMPDRDALAALVAPLKPGRQRIAGYALEAIIPGELPALEFSGGGGTLRVALLLRQDAPNAYINAGKWALVVKSDGEMRGMPPGAGDLLKALARLIATNDAAT